MDAKDLKIVNCLEDINCTKCLHSRFVGDEYYCYYPHDPEKRHEVDETDFCQEHGIWARMGKDELILEDHEDVVAHFYEVFLGLNVTSTLQPPPQVQTWLANTESD